MADVDVVLHLVSATVPGTAALDPGADVSRNLLPTIQLLQNIRKVRVPRLVYLSSGGAVYGVPEVIPTPEEHPLRPTNSYGIVKAAIEHYVRMYSDNENLAATIIRPSNPYGPRQGHTGIQGVVATFLKRLQNDEPLTVWGDGTVVRDYLFIDDLADLVVKAVLSDATGVYNAGSGKGVSINGLIETLRKVTGKAVPVTYKEARPVDVPTSILDIRRANDAFGWEPQTEFLDGVRLHWDWMANR